ncbi:MAG: hypothetical protein JKY93_12625 [Gammaproteobacteria bacterium]|nr:hypothetical protein [Gammaproteobacteria bacterium]
MLQLKINNRLFQGWTAASISRGLKQASATFNLTLTDKWEQTPWQIRPFDSCELVYDGKTVISGYIDSASVSYDKEQHAVSVSGRSKTADIVDCSAPSTQFKQQTIEAIAQALLKPFGIKVQVDVDTGGKISSWKADEGVTIFEALEKLARLRGLLLTDNAAGDLLITRAGINKAPARLELGKNIKAASASFDVRDRFSVYTIKSQQKGSDDLDAAQAAHISATIEDETVPRYRPLLLTAEDQADLKTAKTRIQWEANSRLGNSQTFSIVVVDWQVDGELWQVNQLVRLTDRLLGFDTELLITAVTYSLDENGTICSLTLQPRAALLIEPLTEKTDKQKAKETPIIWHDLNNVGQTDA